MVYAKSGPSDSACASRIAAHIICSQLKGQSYKDGINGLEVPPPLSSPSFQPSWGDTVPSVFKHKASYAKWTETGIWWSTDEETNSNSDSATQTMPRINCRKEQQNNLARCQEKLQMLQHSRCMRLNSHLSEVAGKSLNKCINISATAVSGKGWSDLTKSISKLSVLTKGWECSTSCAHSEHWGKETE